MNNGDVKGTLRLSRKEMQEIGYYIMDLLIDHIDQINNKSVTSKMDRATLEHRLREPLPENGEDIRVILQKLQQDVFKANMKVDHTRFFALIPSPSNFIGVIADMLSSGIIDKMIEDGYAMLSTTVLKGKTVLRMCLINPRTSIEEIKQTIHKLEGFGHELARSL
jgi:hypothetical protein